MITDSFDAPKWDSRHNENNYCGQHDAGHFNIALALAEFILQ